MTRMSFDIEYYTNVAKKVFDEQTEEELQRLKDHFGAAFDEAKIVAQIATSMVIRVLGVEQDAETRAASPIDTLVERGLAMM